MDEDWGATPRKVASRVLPRDVLATSRSMIEYTYDFDDNWEYRLVVSDVRLGDPASAYPRFIDGEHDCPPEDCGGIPGFYEMLEARADPAHPDHAKISEWLDEYDPDVLDIFPIQVASPHAAMQRQSAS